MTQPRTLLEDERGLGTSEYIILIILVVIAGWAAWSRFGDAVSSKIGPSSAVDVVSTDAVV
ncbi:MAG: hypothetical protein AAGE52_13620 [Myxococcota bacterium]